MLFDRNMNAEEHTMIITKNGTDTFIAKNRSSDDTFILPNSGDHAYINTILSNDFVELLKAGAVSKIKDDINRALVWRSLMAMVKNYNLKSTDFIEIVVANIAEETDIVLLNLFLPLFKSYISFFVPNDKYEELTNTLFDRLLKVVCTIPKENEELRDVFKTQLLDFIVGDEKVKLAASWLEDK